MCIRQCSQQAGACFPPENWSSPLVVFSVKLLCFIVFFLLRGRRRPRVRREPHGRERERETRERERAGGWVPVTVVHDARGFSYRLCFFLRPGDVWLSRGVQPQRLGSVGGCRFQKLVVAPRVPKNSSLASHTARVVRLVRLLSRSVGEAGLFREGRRAKRTAAWKGDGGSGGGRLIEAVLWVVQRIKSIQCAKRKRREVECKSSSGGIGST